MNGPRAAGWLATLLGRIRPGGGMLAIEQTLALDGRRRLCIVRCERRRVLLLIGGGQDIVVGWLDDATAPAAEIAGQ